jgi:hypothetical protein
MTKFLIVLISTFGFFSSAKADTIDYWHVYYNNIKIKEYNQYSKGEIVLKIENIKKTDSLTIKYFRDTPCHDCLTNLTIESGYNFIVTKVEGTGTYNPIKVSVFDLVLKINRDYYKAYYYEKNKPDKILLFRIKLE